MRVKVSILCWFFFCSKQIFTSQYPHCLLLQSLYITYCSLSGQSHEVTCESGPVIRVTVLSTRQQTVLRQQSRSDPILYICHSYQHQTSPKYLFHSSQLPSQYILTTVSYQLQRWCLLRRPCRIRLLNNNDNNNNNDDDDDNNNNNNNTNNNNDNNDNHTERRKSRFLQSAHCATNSLQHVRSSGQGVIVCKSRATYRAFITCNLSCATWYDGTAQLISLTEFKSHLFELYFIG